jgi:hypothetical protein
MTAANKLDFTVWTKTSPFEDVRRPANDIFGGTNRQNREFNSAPIKPKGLERLKICTHDIAKLGE